MYEVYFDDSGTHPQSEIAVAACYISTKRGWREFEVEWDHARAQEDFDTFHMSEFVAKSDQGHEPFCEWDNTKKDHVFNRLARIINANKRIGIAAAVPRKAYDSLVPEHIREHHGREHYTFAVRTCLMRIAYWREKCQITHPMKYIFDWEMQESPKRKEISSIWDTMHPSWTHQFGFERGGSTFERRSDAKPLQASDILAWQMNNHMRKILPFSADVLSLTHPGFEILRMDQEMDLGFYTENQLKSWVEDIKIEEAKTGKRFYE